MMVPLCLLVIIFVKDGIFAPFFPDAFYSCVPELQASNKNHPMYSSAGG